MKPDEPLEQHVSRLQTEGCFLSMGTGPDAPNMEKWKARCRNLAVVLDDFGEPLRKAIDDAKCSEMDLAIIRAVLEGIAESMREGVLNRFRGRILATALGDLLDQADDLLKQGYYIGAAVTARAMLEQELRSLHASAGCTQKGKSRPKLSSLSQELHAKHVLDIVQMKQVDAMAAVGNAAAHGLPVKEEDVCRMVKDLRSFLAFLT